ncbi:hypothetical protein SAMN02745111_02306 [Eubacterium uniforme]|uniref:Lipoprotein n=1 Tax=Eubacterium uniforme TaxID=39495 RepID=A0A1T4W512_9FIRM|nr:hypothetical protein [Eubacterium uniforme]SKA72125.1 hypothetical protein SAMN02745111_02306 [Eubacterium uniforme]
MKTWKLVAGILSIVFTVIVLFQSCAVAVADGLEENESTSSGAGMLVAILLLAGGIVSIAVRKSIGKGGNIAVLIIFGLAALIGFANSSTYPDLVVWSGWCAINAGLALVCLIKGNKDNTPKLSE